MAVAIKTNEEATCEKLRELIISNSLPVGEFLSQRKLAEKLEASVSTLRSSLRLLENDGLIENLPKWGVRIPKDTEERIRDRYFVRELLEVGAVERILEARSPEIRKKLELLAEECDKVKHNSAESVREFAEKHMKFHLALAELSESKILYNALRGLNIINLMAWNAERGWARRKGISPDLHMRFVKDIYRFDHDAAIGAVRKHVRDGMENELEVLKNS